MGDFVNFSLTIYHHHSKHPAGSHHACHRMPPSGQRDRKELRVKGGGKSWEGVDIAHGGKFYCYRSAEKSKRSSGGKKALPDFRECCKRASLLFFVGIIAIFIDATKQSIK